MLITGYYEFTHYLRTLIIAYRFKLLIMKLFIRITFLALLFTTSIKAQTNPFQIAIEPMSIADLGGVQSFAWGHHDGKWLIIGGRIDGLHRRQPWASFDEAGHNTQLIVIDPIAEQKWTAPLATLSVGMQEQMSSTNMEFFQEGEYLYIIGGYGYSGSELDHITYPNMTAVKVPEVIDAIINGSTYATYFRQITEEKFAVTGGALNKIYDTFYLTGGQRFDGRYNPMNHPTFVQEYTNAIRKFTIQDDGVNLSISFFPAIIDETNLHRRDYNVVEQIMPNGEEGLTAFSGVFQQDVDLPFLNAVNIDSSGYAPNNDFSQYYNHYHCAQIPLYNATDNEMHTVFFGGIAQYYDNGGTLVQDDNVPFVKTIARVTRDADGLMVEYKLPVEMPSYLGAGSEFIPAANLPQHNNGVLKLEELPDSTLIGYIYGGINSSAANIFFINNGTQSTANSQLFKVFLLKEMATNLDQLNDQSVGTLQLQVSPNPSDGTFHLTFHLEKTTDVQLSIYDQAGHLLESSEWQKITVGEHRYQQRINNLTGGGVYFVKVETPDEQAMQKIIVGE